MHRRTLLGGASTLLLAGCSDLQNTFEEEPPEKLVLSRVVVVNKDGTSSHRVTVVVVADDERVYEETVELPPEGELNNKTEITCEFPEEPTEFEVRAFLPNGTEGSINTTKSPVEPDSGHVEATMQVHSQENIESHLLPEVEDHIPECGPATTS